MIKKKMIKIGSLLLCIWIALHLWSCAQPGSKPKPCEAPGPEDAWYDIATLTTPPRPEVEKNLARLFNTKWVKWSMYGSIVYALLVPDTQTEMARKLLESDPYFMKIVESGNLVFAENYSPDGSKRIRQW